MVVAIVAAALGFAGCGDSVAGSATTNSPSKWSRANSGESTDSSTWEEARLSQDDPDAIKSARDIAGNCVMDLGTGAKICGTAAIDYCAGGLAPAEAQYACEVILADALTPKN